MNPHMPIVRMQAVRLVQYRGWTIRKVARRLGVQPSTVSRWVKKDPTGGWNRIPTLSSRPHHHPRALDKQIVRAVLAKRLKRRRCGQIIHQELKREGLKVSLSSVQRTLERYNLLRKRSPWKRPHDYTRRPEVKNPGDLVEIDTIQIRDAKGKRLYIYTLIDLCTRWAWASPAEQINTWESIKFMNMAMKNSSFPFRMIQSDNGAEFSKMFSFRLNKKSVLHRHTRVGRSDDNAHIERFNRTIQEEALDRVPCQLASYRTTIRSFLKYYNTERLHMGINFLTPLEVLRRY